VLDESLGQRCPKSRQGRLLKPQAKESLVSGGDSRLAGLVGPSSPASYGFDYSEDDQAEPEIHHQTQIHLKRHVTRSWRQILHQEKVGSVPGENRNQSVNKIGRRLGHTVPDASLGDVPFERKRLADYSTSDASC
jgi:hypothetical protein